MSNETTETLDLAMLAEYKRLSDVEKAIKERKDAIKKNFRQYMEANNLTETEAYEDLVATLEERTSFSLDENILQAGLPFEIFDSIVDKKVNLDKAKAQFLDGNIPIALIIASEKTDSSKSFYVRKADREKTDNKQIPFWKVSR